MSEQAVFEALQLRLEVDNAGTRRYYNGEGQLHRVHGPAVEYLSGERWWYQNGKLHRTDGPAVVWSNGTKFWLRNDKKHRTDGPAVEYHNGSNEWWLNGVELSKFEFEQAVGTHDD